MRPVGPASWSQTVRLVRPHEANRSGPVGFWSQTDRPVGPSGFMRPTGPDLLASWGQQVRTVWLHEAERSGLVKPNGPDRLASWSRTVRLHEAGRSGLTQNEAGPSGFEAGLTVTYDCKRTLCKSGDISQKWPIIDPGGHSQEKLTCNSAAAERGEFDLLDPLCQVDPEHELTLHVVLGSLHSSLECSINQC